MLATGRSYVIEKEKNEEKVVDKIWETADLEATTQINENTRRILEKFLDGGSVPLNIGEKIEYNEYDDSMPTPETLKYVSRAKDLEKAQTKGLSTKSKVLIAVYIGIVLGLVMMIALTSISMSTSASGYSELLASQSEVLSEISTLQAQIEEVQNGFDIEGIAAQLGFISPTQENISYYTSPQIRDAQQYTVENNWFDAFCDLLSNLF